MTFRATYTQQVESAPFLWGQQDTPVSGLATVYTKTAKLAPGVTSAVPQPGQIAMVALPAVRLVDVKLFALQHDSSSPVYFLYQSFDPSSAQSLKRAFVASLPVVLESGQLRGLLGATEKLSWLFLWSAADSALVSADVSVDLVLGIAA